MDSDNSENLSEALITLLAGLNEMIRNAYITGFKDGQEFGSKFVGDEAIELYKDRAPELTGGLNLYEIDVLSEAEQILSDNS